jgi:hypothetical protein
VTTEGTGVFLTDGGAEVSVRAVHHHSATATIRLEPLYATDLELMDGVTGVLRGKAGESLRGTLRRRGNVFVLYPEQPQERVLEKTETTAPSGAPPPPLGAEPNQLTPETAPSQAEAIKAPRTVAQVRRGDRSKVLEKTETTVPAAPPAARRAKPNEKTPEPAPAAAPPPLRAEPIAPTPETAPSQAEAMEALKTVAQFLRSDCSKLFERTQTTSPGEAPSQPEAIEAARTVAQFLRGDPSVEIELAKQAQAIVSEFIAERERLMNARDD